MFCKKLSHVINTRLLDPTYHTKDRTICIAISKQHGKSIPHLSFEVTAISIEANDLFILSSELIGQKEPGSYNMQTTEVKNLLPTLKNRSPNLHKLIELALDTWDKDFEDSEPYPTNKTVAEKIKRLNQHYSVSASETFASIIRPDVVGSKKNAPHERVESRIRTPISKKLTSLIELEALIFKSGTNAKISTDLRSKYGFNEIHAKYCPQLFTNNDT